MLEKVKNSIKKYRMIPQGESVLCGLSGGADSTALLLCLIKLGYDVRAMHINHCLRGEEADRDEQFCRELCDKLGVPFRAERVDVRGFCEKNGFSIEEGARKLRYQAFEKEGCDRIATAHTLSDSFETALFNLTRGTAAKGLIGIPPVRGGIIRPLIECTRDEVEQFLAENSQPFVTDSTNLTDDYSRNQIRHKVVPVLKSINPDAEHAFARTAVVLRMDNFALTCDARELLERSKTPKGYDTDILGGARWAVMSRAMVMLLEERGLTYDNARINELCVLARGGTGRVCLSRELCAFASQGYFRIAEPAKTSDEEITVVPDCDFELLGKRVSVKMVKNEHGDNKVHRMFTYVALDYDKIKGKLAVRTRRAGDSIRLDGRGCTKSLKKLFNESVPFEKRGNTLLLCDSEGVAAIEGLGAAERCAVSDETENVLIFEVS